MKIVFQKNKVQKHKAKHWVAHNVNLLSYRYIYIYQYAHTHTFTKMCISLATVKSELWNSVFLVSPTLLLPIYIHATYYDRRKKLDMLNDLSWIVITELNWAFLLISLATPHFQWWPSFLFHSHMWRRQMTASMSSHHIHYLPTCVPPSQLSLFFHDWTTNHQTKAPPFNCSWDSILLLYSRTFFQHQFFLFFGSSPWTYKHAFSAYL